MHILALILHCTASPVVVTKNVVSNSSFDSIQKSVYQVIMYTCTDILINFYLEISRFFVSDF